MQLLLIIYYNIRKYRDTTSSYFSVITQIVTAKAEATTTRTGQHTNTNKHKQTLTHRHTDTCTPQLNPGPSNMTLSHYRAGNRLMAIQYVKYIQGT